MLDVKALLTKVTDALKADFVVEQGTNGSWSYRKWNSGKLDAERLWNIGQVTLNVSEGSTVKASAEITVSTPSEMVSGTIEVTYIGNSSNSAAFIERVTTSNFRFAKFTTSNMTLQGMTVALRTVDARWK